MKFFSLFKFFAAIACILFALASCPVSAKKPSSAEAVIEEVNQKQLERILADKDYVAVYWCK